MRPKGHGKNLTYYDFGRTTVYSLASDQQFCYTLYVPESYDESAQQRHRLIVVVHGSERNFIGYRDNFVPLAETHSCIVLAPLFPVEPGRPDDWPSYKLLRSGGVAYDNVLLSMVEQVGTRYRLDDERFLLYGFSGGGHFAHRFYYAHPERLHGVSIGAPGVVTLLNRDYDYWVGVRNFKSVFGKEISLNTMRDVPVHTVIGGDDTETWEITIKHGNPWWMEGADIAGLDRQARIKSLVDSLERQDIKVRQDVVPGVAHDAEPMTDAVADFFDSILRGQRT